MSNIRSHISQLWNDILKHHWLYLESEESLNKLEQRKKLEGYIRQLLSVVRHDRKFYLPETASVLKNSITNLKDFNIQKAVLAFEAISQYANNLFTKPWRKEFHTLRTYSGFFQHEIKSNLLGAEQLFEAMGYRCVSDQIMILDGAICPDQVTNVSRDAMTAYMELQIIKHISAELDALNYNVTWLDVYLYRENHVGDAGHVIKYFINTLQRQESMHGGGNKTKILPIDNYDYIDVQSNGQLHTEMKSLCPCQCRSVNHTYCTIPDQSIQCNSGYNCAFISPHQQQQQIQQRQQIITPANKVVTYNNLNCNNDLSHACNIDHYIEPHERATRIMPHKHNYPLDHPSHINNIYAGVMLPNAALHHKYHMHQYQQLPNYYDSSYDYADGGNSLDDGSAISYATITKSGNNLTTPLLQNHLEPYNVSGNRYPLPYNISNQLAKQYDQSLLTPSTATLEPLYAQVAGCNNHIYASVMKPQYNHNQCKGDDSPGVLHRHCSSQSSLDQFKIEMDDKIGIATNCIKSNNCPDCTVSYNTYNYCNQLRGDLKESFNNIKSNIDYPVGTLNDECFNGNSCTYNINSGQIENKILMISNNQKNSNFDMNDRNTKMNYEAYMQKDPTTRQTLLRHHYEMNAGYVDLSPDVNQKYGHNTMEQKVKNYIEMDKQSQPHHMEPSLTQLAQKNQDGVGSFESWDYVFQHLKHNSNNNSAVETTDNDDLHFSTLNITDHSDYDHCPYKLHKSNLSTSKTGTKNKINKPTVCPQVEAQMKSSKVINNINNRSQSKHEELQQQQQQQQEQQQQQQQLHKNYKLISPQGQSTGKEYLINIKNTNNNNNTNGNGIKKNSTTQFEELRKNAKPITCNVKCPDNTNANGLTNTSDTMETQLTSLNEWHCRFCTFINPSTKRICDMCYHTKDFDVESDIARHTPTCV